MAECWAGRDKAWVELTACPECNCRDYKRNRSETTVDGEPVHKAVCLNCGNCYFVVFLWPEGSFNFVAPSGQANESRV